MDILALDAGSRDANSRLFRVRKDELSRCPVLYRLVEEGLAVAKIEPRFKKYLFRGIRRNSFIRKHINM